MHPPHLRRLTAAVLGLLIVVGVACAPLKGPPRGVWDRLAQCEAAGNWSANTGNGYYGGLQFSLGTWWSHGGPGYPHQQSRGTQIVIGERVRASQGWGAWPSCSRKLGLR